MLRVLPQTALLLGSSPGSRSLARRTRPRRGVLGSSSTTIVPVQDEEAIGRSALRKASLRLLPLIAIGYGIAYMDRVNISFAALQMNRDLHFSASVYGFGAGLFFLSYAACEVPSNLLLVRFGARRWLARIMFTWGLLSIGMLFVKTPHQFYAMRFLLGVAEAGFFPGIIYYLSRWFPLALALPRGKPLLYLPAAQFCGDGCAGGGTPGFGRPRRSCRMAVAVPDRGPACGRA